MLVLFFCNNLSPGQHITQKTLTEVGIIYITDIFSLLVGGIAVGFSLDNRRAILGAHRADGLHPPACVLGLDILLGSSVWGGGGIVHRRFVVESIDLGHVLHFLGIAEVFGFFDA
jgi:hypothetical protein